MPRAPLLLLALAAALAAVLGAADAASAAPSKQRLERALVGSGIPVRTRSILVLDRRTGKVVYARNAKRALRPASNEKLPVSIAALRRLGPGFRFETRVLASGTRRGRVLYGNLVLRGDGDPTLRGRDVTALARQVRARGITRVTGRVIVDETRYDRRRTAPGWKASFYKEQCPPLSALVVNRGVLHGRIVDRPAVTAGVLFRRALTARGVRVARPNASGRAKPGSATVARVRSVRLDRIVEWMNQESDNFVAELLLKELGTRGGLHRGTSAGGADVVRNVLRELGVPLAGVRIVDGSGLSRENRMTAAALARMLDEARRRPGLAAPFVRSLAVAGRSGTLAWRLHGTPAEGRVAAKTGTTRLASSLSGYVGGRYAFSILMNDDDVPHWSARAGQDRFVTVLASELG